MLKQIEKNPVLRLTMGGVMAALIFVSTMFLKLPIPMANGYVHLGDGLILLGSALVGVVNIPAAALGSMLSDLALGYGVYAPVTFVIKGLVALCAVFALREKRLWLRVVWLLLCECVMVAGYFAFEWPMYGLAAAVASLPGNAAQGASAVILCAILLPVLRKTIK